MSKVDQLKAAVEYVQSKSKLKPRVGIVLGSGLGAFVGDVKAETVIPYSEIPHFHTTTVVGHQGNLILGHVGNVPVVVMQGRFHFYEGHSLDTVVLPTRLMIALGATQIFLTNSSGGLGAGFKAGDFMIIEDHLNFTGSNPLIGKNVSEWGPRFPDMSEAYNKELSAKLESVFVKNKLNVHRGVYAGVSGPTYETPAEVRFFKSIGCGAVGMSTVPETIAANHMGAKVVGLSLITNMAAGLSAHKLTHEEVTTAAKEAEVVFSKIVKEFVSLL